MKNNILLVLGLFVFGIANAQTISTDTVSSGDQNSTGTLSVRLETNEDIDNDDNLDNGEPLVDTNGNGIWDAEVLDDPLTIEDEYVAAETYTDSNGNGQWDGDEDLDNDGSLDSVDEDIDGDNSLDAGETFTDANNNGVYDDAEAYIDSNANGSYDGAEVYADANLNGTVG
jgi:hypothetical protein